MSEVTKGKPQTEDGLTTWRKDSLATVKEKIKQKRLSLYQLHQDTRLGKISDTSRLAKMRKELARMLTVLKEKEFLASKETVS